MGGVVAAAGAVQRATEQESGENQKHTRILHKPIKRMRGKCGSKLVWPQLSTRRLYTPLTISPNSSTASCSEAASFPPRLLADLSM